MYRNYLYKCPICSHEQNYSVDRVNERCYCQKCEKDGKAVLMDQIKVNKDVKVELLIEDDCR